MVAKISVVSGLELWQWRTKAQTAAIAANVSVNELDWLLQTVSSLDKLALRLESFKNYPQIDLQFSLEHLTQLWQQRLQDRWPVQYLVGTTTWRHFSLKVSPAVLVPRPETESLIDLVVEVADRPTGAWADLGTGSGAIALGLAAALTDATIYAIDCSQQALDIARVNAEKLGFTNQIKFYQGSWFEPLNCLKGKLSGIVSNPPYIPSAMIPTLPPEVCQHEPHLALDGGPDGLDCIRHLITTAPLYLQSGGVWLIEMMIGQAQIVADLLHAQGSYSEIKILPDLAGIERFAIARKL